MRSMVQKVTGNRERNPGDSYEENTSVLEWNHGSARNVPKFPLLEFR
jgi:hypothetical protein